MAHTAYIKMIGETQGCITQGCNTDDSIGRKAQISHTDEATVLACNYSLEKEADQVRKTLSALTITKPIDKASPLLGLAFSKQEKIQCEIRFYRTNDKGHNENHYTIELVDAVIAHLSFNQPHVLISGDEDMSEDIALRYKDIVWKHNITGTQGYERWE
ncbi:type VI secretion system tube protein TssD [Salinivibrio sp. ES.052]|uniref:type VI secretion system tube protein TssD n=1 Tax=Salinivibrio sp. ES.052 TaxID=1882823 RepID=UPI000926C7B2|nr:type VI secretion system tube protein TssD [Salinivibrio sp. ES.052]SIO37607.1 hypothetical protein SAMN05444724_3095 [Salinivibrio sp. ES.052]